LNRIVFALTLLVASAVLISGTIVVASEGPGPGAFLKYRVNSPNALADQIVKEPRVGARYHEHFDMTAQAFSDYVRKNLELISLSKPTVATVYFMSKHGGTSSEKRVLPAGTRVFATKDKHAPVLEWRCGNPLAASLPMVLSAKPAEPKTAGAIRTAQPPATPVTPSATVAQTPTTTVEGATDAVVPPPAVSVLPSVETLTPPITPVVPATAPVEVAATPAVTAPPIVTGGSHSFPWLIPLILGAGAGLAGGGGDNHPNPTPVPEPTTMVIIATSAAAFGLRMTTRRK
jgi:hypothetical protein